MHTIFVDLAINYKFLKMPTKCLKLTQNFEICDNTQGSFLENDLKQMISQYSAHSHNTPPPKSGPLQTTAVKINTEHLLSVALPPVKNTLQRMTGLALRREHCISSVDIVRHFYCFSNIKSF